MKKLKRQLRGIEKFKVYASSYTLFQSICNWSKKSPEEVFEHLIQFWILNTDEPFVDDRLNERYNTKFLSAMEELGLLDKLTEPKEAA